MNQARSFIRLKERDRKLHDFARKAVELERDELLSSLEKLPMHSKERLEILRGLWVVTGILDEGLDCDLLN